MTTERETICDFLHKLLLWRSTTLAEYYLTKEKKNTDVESLLKLSLYYGNMNEIVLFYSQAKIKFCLLSYFQVSKVSSVFLKCFKEENNRFRHRDNEIISQSANVLVEEWVLAYL